MSEVNLELIRERERERTDIYSKINKLKSEKKKKSMEIEKKKMPVTFCLNE